MKNASKLLTNKKFDQKNPVLPEQQQDIADRIEPGEFLVIKRDGTVVSYDDSKISIAMTKAFLAVEGQTVVASSRVRNMITHLTEGITATFHQRMPSGGVLKIEDIQDQVELALMRAEQHKVARNYVLYREKRARLRREEAEADSRQQSEIHTKNDNGITRLLDLAQIKALVTEACQGLDDVDPELIVANTLPDLYDGISVRDVVATLIMTARAWIEREPDYNFVTARLLLNRIVHEALSFMEIPLPGGIEQTAVQRLDAGLYARALRTSVERAVSLEFLSPKLLELDLDKLGYALQPGRDLMLGYLGLQTLYDRYFLHCRGTRFELPQVFFMRVAMGLSLNEKNPEDRAIEFYDIISNFLFMPSTPTLFNSGAVRSQLSSCYLSTIEDSLEGIFDAIRDNALLSKWAGGLGNDWTPVRALGSYIKGTNGKSQGVVPFLKVVNDTAVAVNQGGKRKGAVCSYLETWHLDIEEFLELRKNTGDDRRRTHDMHTANWVPDLFMKRVHEDLHWTLFSPDTVADLHDLTGKAFADRYEQYERMAETGAITPFRKVRARELWRKMLSMLFETGHPWITFKDACHLRSPQQHCGVVHSSNLCTEITLNTSRDEVAVCNLGSINLAAHLDQSGELDMQRLRTTVRCAVRMLDNVIDLNYYAIPAARNSNIKHRPIGLGLMGYQDALIARRTPFESEEAVEFADASMEAISYFAIEASSDLAVDRGHYQSYLGSLWSRGILPHDSLDLLKQERGNDNDYLHVDRTERLDWTGLRKKVISQGMRNSNTMAIAPTATIANIVGVSQSIEPLYQNLYVKSNLSGEFTVVNPSLIRDLKDLGLWDSVILNDLKYYNGSLSGINRIPERLKELYATAFEISPEWIVKAASRRQKWIDQSQSLNLYIAGNSGKKLDIIYRMAWLSGLKTTYYLRSLAATDTEKSTVDARHLNAIQSPPAVCAIDDQDCEACQ